MKRKTASHVRLIEPEEGLSCEVGMYEVGNETQTAGYCGKSGVVMMDNLTYCKGHFRMRYGEMQAIKERL